MITATSTPVLYGFTASFIDDTEIEVVEVWQVDIPGGKQYAQVGRTYAPDATSIALVHSSQAAVLTAFSDIGTTVSF